jgi:2,3-dihydroxybenzoate-AMP ligase
MLEGCQPWPEQFSRLYRDKGYWEDRTVVQAIEASIENCGKKDAIIFNGQRISYLEMGEKIDRLAYGFSRSGLKPLDRVVFQLNNTPIFVYAFLALLQIGVIPVMALPRHRKNEILHFAKHSGAVGYLIPDIVHDFDYRVMADEIRTEVETLNYVFVSGSSHNAQISIDQLLASAESNGIVQKTIRQLCPPPDEVALLLLSGGTTALPKLIPRTHNDYVYNFKQSGIAAGFNADTIFLALLPMAHNYSLASPGILATLFHGGTVVISPSSKADAVFSLVEKEKVTAICAAVPLIVNWLNSDVPARYDLSSLEIFMNGGARLAPELRRRVESQFHCTFVESFGTGEGLLNQTLPDDSDNLRFHSSGKPVSPGDEIKVVDESGIEVPEGECGELLCRGPYTIRGYYKAPEADERSFTDDGFYKMGDEVKLVNGYVYVVGRRSDLINRGGEKISSEEVENHILAFGKVKSVCVVAMPDEVYGEKTCAFVIPKENSSLSFEELIEFLSAREIAKFKLPERLELVQEFPISPAGKILRRELRANIANKISAEKSR